MARRHHYLFLAAGCALLAASGPAREEPLTQLREIPVPALIEAGQQNLATGPDGRVYLTWIDPQPDSSHALRFAVLGGSQWSQPRTIAQGRDWFINWADFPSLAAGPGGRLAAHWLQKSGRGRYAYDVRLSRSDDGGTTWSPPVIPHRDATATEHGFATLWSDSLGFTAVWVDGRKTADSNRARHEMTLRAASWTAGGTMGAEVELDSRICDCCQTSAAMTSEGPVVVYRDRTADEIRDIGIVRLVNGVWTAPATIGSDNWRINACPVNGPSVSAIGRRVAVAWYTQADDMRAVKLAVSNDAGASFDTFTRIDDGHPVGRVSVVLLDDGAALVSWLEDAGAGAEVRVRRVEVSGVRGDHMVIARTTAGRPSGYPRMVRSGNRIVFAWREPEGGARIRTATARIRS